MPGRRPLFLPGPFIVLAFLIKMAADAAAASAAAEMIATRTFPAKEYGCKLSTTNETENGSE